jgi:hypothetical protein
MYDKCVKLLCIFLSYFCRSIPPPKRYSGNNHVAQFCLRFTSTHRLSQLEKETCSQVSQLLRLAVTWNIRAEICLICVLFEAPKCLATFKVLSISCVAQLLLGFGWGRRLSPLQLQRAPAGFRSWDSSECIQSVSTCYAYLYYILLKISSRLKGAHRNSLKSQVKSSHAMHSRATHRGVGIRMTGHPITPNVMGVCFGKNTKHASLKTPPSRARTHRHGWKCQLRALAPVVAKIINMVWGGIPTLPIRDRRSEIGKLGWGPLSLPFAIRDRRSEIGKTGLGG